MFHKAAENGSDAASGNIGYMFQHGAGVQKDYAQAMSWFDKAVAQGNSDAENQLGWMYQFGQGVDVNDTNALAWYQLSADAGNKNGQNNLQALRENLKNRNIYGAANLRVTDPNIAAAQRWVKIQDLRSQINGLEGDAQQQEDLAYQLEHTGNGKNNTMTKLFNAVGSVPAEKYHAEAAKYRAEASQLCEQLAGIEDQGKSASVPTP